MQNIAIEYNVLKVELCDVEYIACSCTCISCTRIFCVNVHSKDPGNDVDTQHSACSWENPNSRKKTPPVARRVEIVSKATVRQNSWYVSAPKSSSGGVRWEEVCGGHRGAFCSTAAPNLFGIAKMCVN
jgi:hypothetical protein